MNQVQSDALDEVLVARAAMYGLLQRVFSDVPDRALAENESCEVMDQCFEVLGEAWGLRDCRTCKVGEGAGPKVPEQDIDAVPLTLEGEYNRLFVGVGKPAVCMWEIYLRYGDQCALSAEYSRSSKRVSAQRL